MKKILILVLITVSCSVFYISAGEDYHNLNDNEVAPGEYQGTGGGTEQKDAHNALCHSLLNPEVKGCVEDHKNRTCSLDVFCN